MTVSPAGVTGIVDAPALREPAVAPELVIFDCDGVLVDSEVLVIAEEVELLRSVGIVVTADDVAERFTGRSDASIFGELREYTVSRATWILDGLDRRAA